MKYKHYLLVLTDKDGKVADSFSLNSTGTISPVITYKGTLGLHPEIKEVTDYPQK